MALAVLLGQGATGHSALLAHGSASGLLRSSGEVAPGKPMVVVVPSRSASRILSVVVSISEPGSLSADAMLDCRVEEDGHGARCLLTKRLDLCDADLAGIVQQVAGTTLRIRVSRVGHVDPVGASDGDIRLAVSVADLGPADARAAGRVDFETEPNDTPETANLLVLGRRSTAWPTIGPTGPPMVSPAGRRGAARESIGSRFQFDGPTPRLAYFALDFVDRDVPPDVRVFQQQDGRMVEYTRGIDPQSLQRERPPRPGANKFTTRVLEPGDLFRPGGRLPARVSAPDEALRRAAVHPPRRGPDRESGSHRSGGAQGDPHGDGLPAPGRR